MFSAPSPSEALISVKENCPLTAKRSKVLLILHVIHERCITGMRLLQNKQHSKVCSVLPGNTNGFCAIFVPAPLYLYMLFRQAIVLAFLPFSFFVIDLGIIAPSQQKFAFAGTQGDLPGRLLFRQDIVFAFAWCSFLLHVAATLSCCGTFRGRSSCSKMSASQFSGKL